MAKNGYSLHHSEYSNKNDRMCAANTIDLFILLDITLSDNVWYQLKEYISNIITDINNKMLNNSDENNIYNSINSCKRDASLLSQSKINLKSKTPKVKLSVVCV